MERHYKLAANFNTVEFTITDDDLMSALNWETEVRMDPDDIPCWDVADEELISRILQREYDILAGVKCVPAQPKTTVIAEPVEKPSDKQIAWAKNLGMKNPEKASKQEVWKYIQANK